MNGQEEKLRELIRSQPFGDWDEWAPIAYDRIPVLPRAAMGHLYGRHDDTELPYMHCVLCQLFRVDGSAEEIAADMDEEAS